MPLQLRRGTNLQRQNMQEPLATGELIYITDTGELYIGDGTNVGGNPVTQYSTATIKSLAAGVLTGGAHTGISFVYDSVSGTIDAVVDPDLSNYQGVIRASAFNGSLVADDSTELVNAIDGKIELDGTVKGNIVPNVDQAYDIGSAVNKFKDIYLSGNSIFLGDAQITASGATINLPAGSTINGTAIGSGSGAVGDGVIEGSTYKINIAADDSSIMIDTGAETVTADGGIFGNVTGNLEGNVTGSMTGNVKGSVFADDSTLLVDAIDGVLRGTLLGTVTGDVTGNVNGTDGLTILVDANNNRIFAPSGFFGDTYATDSTLLIDTGSKAFLGVVQTGDITLSAGGIVSTQSNGSPGLLNLGSPTQPIEVILNLNDNVQFRQLIDPAGGSGFLDTLQSRGTIGSPAAAQAGDELGGLLVRAFSDNTTPAFAGVVGFFVDPTANITGGPFIKTKVIISAATDTGQELDEAFILDSAGTATSNAFVAQKFMQLPVYADDAGRSTAIPTPAKGMMVFMTSGTDPVVTNKPVIYNGTVWEAF